MKHAAPPRGTGAGGMRLLVALEHHFLRAPDGHIYAQGPPSYPFWQRYLEVFPEVLVLARIGTTDRQPPAPARADGPGVAFHGLADYSGPWQYARRLPRLRAAAWAAVGACDAYLLRAPGWVAHLAWKEIRRRKRPYALEVLGDPWEVFAPGAVRSALRPLWRRVAARQLRAMARGAAAAAYVTHEGLSARYPPAAGAVAASFSDVELDGAFAGAAPLEARRRRLAEVAARQRRPRIGFLGSFAQLYKGADVLLRAAAACRARGVELEVDLAGDGRYRPEMERLAARLGLDGSVRFRGRLPHGPAVAAFLDETDLFVLPSRAEGMPRALVEAMARGCPCVASRVGGVAELLPPGALVTPGDAEALAQRLLEVLSGAGELAAAVERNYRVALRYRPEVLAPLRRQFLEDYRRVAEAAADGR